jgi:hypothetical protein
MKRREGIPVTYSVPVSRRRPKIEQIRVTGSFKPEPALSKDDYEEILDIMKNMARVMELSPHAFEEMGEEALRSHFPEGKVYVGTYRAGRRREEGVVFSDR